MAIPPAALRAAANRLGNLIIRAVVTLTQDSPLCQTVQVTGRDGEVKDKLEHLHPYGLTSRVRRPDGGHGAETLVIAIDRDHRVALPAMDRRYRPRDIEEGEVVLHDWRGQVVHLRADGILVETTRPEGVTVRVVADAVTITAPVTVNGDVQVNGSINATGTIIDAAGNTNHHTH
jgi:phage baseplate assembly protein V